MEVEGLSKVFIFLYSPTHVGRVWVFCYEELETNKPKMGAVALFHRGGTEFKQKPLDHDALEMERRKSAAGF